MIWKVLLGMSITYEQCRTFYLIDDANIENVDHKMIDSRLISDARNGEIVYIRFLSSADMHTVATKKLLSKQY